MKFLTIIILFNIFYSISTAVVTKKCEYNLKPFRTRVPIFVQNDEIYYPDSEIIRFKPRETVTLACPGRGNRFDIHDRNAIQAIDVTCTNGKLNSAKGVINLMELKCTRAQPAADIETTDTPCANGEGRLKEISFRYMHDDVIKIIPLYKTCYNKDKWESLYAVHTINGGYWQDVLRSSFVDTGSELPKEIKLNTYYNQKHQNETILKIHKNLTVYWLKNYLARGHLAPCADFNYCTTQAASFYYINAAPQWQKFNAGNWLSVEYQVRNLVKTRQEPLTVYTGGHDILKFKDLYGRWHPIYLADGSKLPVPKYYWKVVYSPKTREGIVFVGLNNIYTNSSKDLDDLCENICEKEGYYMPSYNDKKKGLVTCCKLNEIKKKIPRMSDVPTGISKIMSNVAHDRSYTEFLEVFTSDDRGRTPLHSRFGKFYESFNDDVDLDEFKHEAINPISIISETVILDPKKGNATRKLNQSELPDGSNQTTVTSENPVSSMEIVVENQTQS